MASVGVTALHLVDTSAWAQRLHHEQARGRIDALFSADRAATCLPVALEVLYRARNSSELDRQWEALRQLHWLEVTPDAKIAAIDVMRKLAKVGQHRTPIPDVMIAAVAQAHSATVLHYDSDFERICAATGHPHEWIVSRGTGHGGANP